MLPPDAAVNPWPTLENVADAVLTCRNCQLCEARVNAVPGDGLPSASVMFIGEGPGKNEDEQGLPFVGRAGQLLNELLELVPLRRDDVYITNVVKCRPPGNRDPRPDEVAACMPYLERQIELIDPRVIVTLGRHALTHFYPDGKISRDHGQFIDLGSRVLLPLYHPAAALRNSGLKQVLADDIRRIPQAMVWTLKPKRAPAAESPDDATARDPGTERARAGGATRPPAVVTPDRDSENGGAGRRQLDLL